LRLCFVTGTAGCAGVSEATRSHPPRADAQTTGADRASRVDLLELAPPNEGAVLGYRAVQVELRVTHEAALQVSDEHV
jgi:hypothetical protein